MKSIFLMWFITTVYSHYIVFENIGQMASSVTYINVKVTLKVTEVEKMIIKYKDYVQKLYVDITKIQTKTDSDIHAETLIIAKQAEEIAYTFMLDSRTLQNDFNLVRWLLPTPPPREERFLEMFGLGLGIMGTFLGVYNTAQISQINSQLGKVEQNQNKIVQSLISTQTEQQHIQDTIKFIDSITSQWRKLNPPLIGVRLARMEKLIQRLIHKITHTFQMAQAHKLAIDFMSADDLNKLYQQIKKKADQHKLSLITTKPLDLFQLEISYFSDGQDLHLLLHVPAVAKDSLLRLFKMHPLPLPINNQQALIPHVTDNVLGLTHGENKLAAHLSSTDLLDCKQINKVFLCERHGILNKHINSSCMGALYQQNFQSAADLCPLITKPLEETLHQLADNWFLIYSIKPQTAPISCNNGTESQFYLPAGISRNHLSPGCKANFNNHILLTDNSITLENNIQHFDWTWMTDFSMFDNITDHLMQMHDFGFTHPTLSEIHHFESHSNLGFSNIWHKATIYISLTLAIILAIFLLICCTNKYIFKRFMACMLFSSKYLPQEEPTDIELAEGLFPSHNPIIKNQNLNQNQF